MPIAALPDAQIHYELRGPENLPPLIFSNSLGTTLEMWDSQVGEFTKHFRVLRYDTRGHGRSEATPGDYSIAKLADDVLQLLDLLQFERVFFCGLSMGGAIGIYLGAYAPQRFRKLVLCNTAPKFGTMDTWNARIQAVRSGGMKAVAGTVVERWFTEAFRSAHLLETETIRTMLENANPHGYLSCCAAVRDVDARPYLPDVRVPSLVLTGSHDPVAPPAEARNLVADIPASRYAEVSAAHLSNIEARDDFNLHVLKFLLS